MTSFVNQTVTDQGITVTAVQSITDNYYTHLVFKVEGYFIDKPIHVELGSLEIAKRAEVVGNIIDGDWNFDWDLQGSEDMRTFTLNSILGNTGATVIKVQISPISISVEYEFPYKEVEEIGLDENGQEILSTLYAEPPYLAGVKMKDGTLFTELGGAGAMGYLSEDFYIVPIK